jgi:hypothetical protein
MWFTGWIAYDYLVWQHPSSITNYGGIVIVLCVSALLFAQSKGLHLPMFSKKGLMANKWVSSARTEPKESAWLPGIDSPTIPDAKQFKPIESPSLKKKMFKPMFKPVKVWHFTFLRTINRVVAAIVFFFDIIFFMGTVSQSNVVWFAAFFFLNAYVCLKYLWSSKKVKIEFET